MRTVKRPVLPPRVAAHIGKVDRLGHAMAWTHVRLQELAWLAESARRHGTLSESGLEQWVNLQRRFRRPEGLLSELIAHDREWQRYASAVATFELGGPTDGLWELVEAARHRKEERARAARASRSSQWRAWIREQAAKGGGALHRYVKRQPEQPEHTVLTATGPSASAQDKVNCDRGAWEAIWGRLTGIATAPWRDCSLADEDLLAAPEPKEMRDAARKFKENTGIGCDSFRPAWFAWASDDVLGMLGKVMVGAERVGRWPETLAVLMMHLIPKAAGGTRPIALLASVLRLWEKVRAPTVSGWELDSSPPPRRMHRTPTRTRSLASPRTRL